MDSYVTITWLIVTGIAICAIFIPITIVWSKGKVNKETCNIIHGNVNSTLLSLVTTIKENGEKLSDVANAVIRIETILNKK